MRINRTTLAKNYVYNFDEDIDFSSYKFSSNVKAVNSVNVNATVIDYGNVLHIDLLIKCDVIAICAYTLDDVLLPLKFKDELDFSDNKYEQEQYFYMDKQIFDLDPYILGLILANVPSKVIKKGAKLPKSGDGYRVLTEDELIKEKEQETDPRWSKLDDIKL